MARFVLAGNYQQAKQWNSEQPDGEDFIIINNKKDFYGRVIEEVAFVGTWWEREQDLLDYIAIRVPDHLKTE